MQLEMFNALVNSTLDPHGRQCLWCKEKKKLEAYNLHNHSIDGYNTVCKLCIKEAGKVTKKLRFENAHLKTDICDSCGKHPKGRRGLVVDHDHNTLKFRGWLCEMCNLGIGQLGDDLEGVGKALTYLKEHYE